ncbi:hypothetical protein B0T20DRAFT_14361 [Sordaria brevicollis]|uniref:Uncharacterized protein n=1 Tax=Sordaria brevicollis TaxID=83679 RepID=A0AAE0PNL0_SORBR|nr:hypothetical protein B0T20DRAFT_14361 [Sordaria brevicollis]
MNGLSGTAAVGSLVTYIGFLILYAGFADATLLVFFIFVRNGFFGENTVEICARVAQTFVVTAAVFLLFQLIQILRLKWTTLETSEWDGHGQVLLLPCRTTHTRLSPKSHTFSYAYLVVGVPVGYRGNVANMVSVGVKRSSNWASWLSSSSQVQKAWFDVDASDYLQRQSEELTLREKLDNYFETQGVDPATYPHAYLVTAARFLCHQFNPVSFWYLYDSNKYLAAMILEVNNTFGERHMYLLKRDPSTVPDALSYQLQGNPADPENMIPGEMKEQADGIPFTQVWPKVFHVSPFNSCKGYYSMIATDPLSTRNNEKPKIDVTIRLSTSEGYDKFVANLRHEGPAIDPVPMTTYQKAKFIGTWGWVGLATSPRILLQAHALFFYRQLHVWFRPEPSHGTIARNANPIESQLEKVFRRFLRHLVQRATLPLEVSYIGSGIAHDTERMLSHTVTDVKRSIERLEFKVLTPAFYTRFVYYAHDIEAFFCEMNENRTIWLSNPKVLPALALRKTFPPPLTITNPWEFLAFKGIQRLRRRPDPIERPLTSNSVPRTTQAAMDIRNFRPSFMDAYVLTHEDPATKAAYRECVLRLFLADRIALGYVSVLEVQRLVAVAWFAWMLASPPWRDSC